MPVIVIIKHLKINIDGNKVVKNISSFISEESWFFFAALK